MSYLFLTELNAPFTARCGDLCCNHRIHLLPIITVKLAFLISASHSKWWDFSTATPHNDILNLRLTAVALATDVLNSYPSNKKGIFLF